MQKMDPLGKLQVAVKNNVDIHYFSCIVPYHVFFTEDGQLGQSKVCGGRKMIKDLLVLSINLIYLKRASEGSNIQGEIKERKRERRQRRKDALKSFHVPPPFTSPLPPPPEKSDYLRMWKDVGDNTESINQIKLVTLGMIVIN